MKKLMIALAAIAMTTGFAANAANDKKNDKKCDATKCEQKACPKDCAAGCPEMGMAEFEGLQLTDAQKDQLKAIKAERRDAAKKAKEAKQEAKKAEKGAKADARRQCRQEYLQKVKAVLTPEQYVQFLENQVTKGGKECAPRMNKGQRHQMKADKPRDFKGRPEMPNRAAKAEK